MTCALCQRERKLCNGHIVPGFLLDRLRDDDPNLLILNADEAKSRYLNADIVEKMMCEECDSRLGTDYEGYASQFFTESLPLGLIPDGRYLRMTGLEYAPMKLFLMSLLWRYGITTNPWYRGADLGPHVERLRSMILAGDPGEPWQYGCIFCLLTDKGEIVRGITSNPDRVRISNQTVYRVCLGGFMLTFFVASHPVRIRPDPFLQRDGTFIIEVGEIRQINYLRKFMQAVANHRVVKEGPPSKK